MSTHINIDKSPKVGRKKKQKYNTYSMTAFILSPKMEKKEITYYLRRHPYKVNI